MCSERHRRDKTGPSGGITHDREPVSLVRCTRNCYTPLFSLLLITFTISLLVIPSQARPFDPKDDTLCNVGGVHECVCNRSSGNLDSLGHQHCDRIFEDKTLPVIRILMRNVNLNGRLHTNESYQEYFRRRVANLVSKYCEHQANECPGTSLRLTKVDSSEPQLMDDAEPLIAQENVVILRVSYPDRGRTEVFFVVLKNLTTKSKIGREDVMDNSLVKSVLSVQLAPLSRVLGGIRIEKLEKAEISRKRPPADNTKLITIVCIIAALMVPCYIIAIFRVCRDYHQKKKAQANLSSDKNKRNYGTCTDKFLPICEVPNGKPKTKSVTSDGSVKSKKSRTNAVNHKMEVTAIETEPLQERDEPAAYQRMFICDPSQLPDESILLEEVEPGGSIGSPSENIEADDTSEPSPSALPSVVLVQSNSHVEITPEKNNNKQEAGSTFLGSANSVPYERPLSRRGSRVSTPEQGEEYTETREDTPQPLGDDVFESPKEVPAVTIAINDTAVAKSSTAHKFSHWSSDSEPEPNEVYQKLDESDEDIVLPKAEKKTRTKKASDRTRERSLHSESSASEEEDVLDRHQYERLQESPLPPATVNEPPIALDSTLQYNHDSLNHSDLDLK